MGKKIILGCVLLLIITVVIIFAVNISYNYNENTEGETMQYLDENKDEIYVVPTIKDAIRENTAWCGTFQLVWNDMQDNLVQGDVIFEEPNIFADNLNKQSFKETDLSEESYYKKWGLVSLDLKSEIEKGIKDKFNETSDILDSLDWIEEPEKYLFYAMLKKEFEFPKEFDILEKSNFKDIENVEYFGIEENTDSSVRNQVDVLYYSSKNNFAVKLNTKNNDEIIIARKNDGVTFEEIYNTILKHAEDFEGNTQLGSKDILKVPNLNMDVLKEFDELTEKVFIGKDGLPMHIDKALQSIKMELNNKGGKIKSEAAIVTMKSALITTDTEPREFIFNDDYVIFLKEKDKEVPYFAASISDINLFMQK